MGHALIIFVSLLLLGCGREITMPSIDYTPPSIGQGSQDASEETLSPSKVLYIARSGDISGAFEVYNALVKATNKPHYELLRSLALILLEQGIASPDKDIQMLTTFGAGIASSEATLPILKAAFLQKNPEVQLTALGFLAGMKEDDVASVIDYGMGSPYLLIRLETAYALAIRKSPGATEQIESLMHKMPPELEPLFPPLFALIGDSQAIKILHRELMSHNTDVRVESILACAKYGRDDLLPTIRELATHLNIQEQEAAAFALGVLKDTNSIAKIEALANSPTSTVRLAALKALYELGDKDKRLNIEEMAKTGDIFAIQTLGSIEGSEDLLAALTEAKDLNISLNAAFALEQRRDPRCLSALSPFLIEDNRDLGFQVTTTPGRSIIAIRAVPSKDEKFYEDPFAAALSMAIREDVLQKTIDLPEEDFIKATDRLFATNQKALIPKAISLLENSRSPAAILLLKKYQEVPGMPLLRTWCNLALYRLHEEGPYKEVVLQWIESKQGVDLIKFRKTLPWSAGVRYVQYELTPEETSRLYIESLATLSMNQDAQGINTLVNVMEKGNPENRYALSGLLIRATE